MASEANNFAQMSSKDRDLIYEVLMASTHKDLVTLFIDVVSQETLDALVETTKKELAERGKQLGKE